TVLLSDLGLRTAAVILIFTILLLNLMFTRKSLITAISTPRTVEDDDGVISINQSPLGSFITPKHVTTIFILLSLALAIFVSSALRESWIVLQNYLNATLFNLNDPIFSKDVGFYTFQLPFYNLIYQLLTWSIILSALVVAAIYFFIDSSRGNNKIFSSELSRLHISALAAVFFIVKAWGYKLQQYGLLFSDSGVIFGASYTDVHARLLGLNILMVIAIITAIVILVSIYTRRFRFILHSIGALVAASILVGVAYPLAIQNFVVSPNELARERPYIENSIMFTRYAYNLDRIDKRPFPAGRVLTREQIDQNPEAINNIRLWDWRPLGETYKQLQEMRPYYDFMNLSIDRYLINGEYRQVMLASREMNQTKLPDRAHTWVNQRLQYTHGYGVAISPVNEVTEEGLPKFFMQNIPPVTNTDLIINRPEIYYGETQDDFVIVNTGVEEFDYPIGGDHNAFTTYQEESGVKINSLIRKALLALYFNDYRMLISSDIEYDSQVLFKRNIRERVSHVAPFLKYDGDPYLVLNQGNGRLQWIWDAYTITNMFPYSEPFNGRDNYIRNAVKVVIDAYNGDVTFYVSDPSDPIIQTYQKIFPELFTHIDNMDQELINHLRYPVDLFEIQANKFILYHMTDPVNFYSKEDKWQIPNEQYFGNIQRMEPYYVITKLPGQEEPEFVL
ncbi:MAG: UPF0182 family protein, partial [Tissierellia bacterium]|nr:UPF0182 family protein [Tissierellia bacterium]